MRNGTKLCLAGLVVLCGAPWSAFAQGAEHGSGDPVRIDLWQAGFTIAVFVILLIILRSFAFKPILKALQSREEFIAKSIHDADDAAKKAQKLLADYQQQLDAARADASAIVEEGRRDAEVVKRRVHDEARAEAEALIARAKREVGIARDTAVRELYDLGARLATEVAGKLIAREINPADHERLIADSIAELKKVSGKATDN